jgi:hypothetical protein
MPAPKKKVIRPWTARERSTAIALLSAGKKQAWVARHLNRSPSSVSTIAAEVGLSAPTLPRVRKAGELSARVKALAIPGVSDLVIAEILGVTKITVWNVRDRLGIPRTDPQKRLSPDPRRWTHLTNAAKFLRLYSGVGRSDAEIAKLMGLARPSVSAIRQKFGLPPLGAAGDRGNETTAEGSVMQPPLPLDDAKALLLNGVRFSEVIDRVSDADQTPLREWYVREPNVPNKAGRAKYDAMNGAPKEEPVPELISEPILIPVHDRTLKVRPRHAGQTPKVSAASAAKSQGYTGNSCIVCQGVRMKRNGSCECCEDCGATTGCA